MHMCVCLHWLAIKLAEVIRICDCERPTVTLKCCKPRLKKNVGKNT